MTMTQSGQRDLAFGEAIERLVSALDGRNGPIGRSNVNELGESSHAPRGGVAALVELCMYSQALPAITPELLAELQESLPAVIQDLGQLGNQPERKVHLQELTQLLRYDDVDVERQAHELPAWISGISGERPLDLAALLQRDLAGPARNPVALVALGVAAIGLGYTIAHTWNR
jgi:hypothetical protein